MELDELKPCPLCGRKPMRVRNFHRGIGREESRVEVWVQCSRWFGLRPCMRGRAWWNFKGWSDIAHRRSAEEWNKVVSASTPEPPP